MMGIAGHARTDQAGLRSDKPQMGLVPLADGLLERRDYVARGLLIVSRR